MDASSHTDLTIARLALQGSVCCRLCGESMGHALPGGCEVRILANVSDIGLGDIVLFLGGNGQLIAHRAISIRGNLVTTKGDRNTIADHPMQTDQLLGVVEAVTFRGRWVNIRRWHVLASMASRVSAFHSACRRGGWVLRVLGRLVLAVSPEIASEEQVKATWRRL